MMLWGGVGMFLSLLQFFATKFLVLALHLESGSFPRPLSAREETEAFSALRAGDPAAREKLIRHNLRLVAHIVKKYYALPGDQDDLVSIGTIGLIKAVDSYKSGKGVRLATYASRCIDNELLMTFRSAKKQAKEISLSEPINGEDGEGNTLQLLDLLETNDEDVAERLRRKRKKNIPISRNCSHQTGTRYHSYALWPSHSPSQSGADGDHTAGNSQKIRHQPQLCKPD